MLDEASRSALLRAAREAVRAAATGSAPPVPPELPGCGGYADAGAFVTLTSKGDLRGCIGLFRGKGSLGRTVVAMAALAVVGRNEHFHAEGLDRGGHGVEREGQFVR